MQSFIPLLRRLGLIAFAAFCLYPYFAYAVNSALHAAFGVYLCNGFLLPYGICTFGILTRESFVELLRIVNNFRLSSRVSPPGGEVGRGGFHWNLLPLLNGGILTGCIEMAQQGTGLVLTVTAPWYRRHAVYFARSVLSIIALSRAVTAIPLTVWWDDYTVPSPLVAIYTCCTRILSPKVFGGLFSLFYEEGVRIYTPGFVTHKLCVDGLGCLYLFAGGLLPNQSVYLAMGHLPLESVQAMSLELNAKFGLNGIVTEDASLPGLDRIRIVYFGKQDYFTEILRGDYFSRIFQPR